jgi:hypothetical protein
MTETQKKIAEWQATRPAFVGKIVAQPMPGKQARRTAKAQLVKRANGK